MSQFEPRTVEVGDDVYKISLLEPKAASDLLADLVAILAPTIAPFVDAADLKTAPSQVAEVLGGADDAKVDDRSFERAVAAFFSRFDKRKQREVVEILVAVTSVVKDGKEAKLSELFAVHFRGRMAAMYRWLAAALKVQYADFFDFAGPAIAAGVRRLGLG